MTWEGKEKTFFVGRFPKNVTFSRKLTRGLSRGWIGFGTKLLEMGDKMIGRDAGFDSGSPDLDLHDAVRQTFVADDDLEGSTDEIGIIEFDTRAIGTVVPQYFDARRRQIGIEMCGGSDRLFGLTDRQKMDMEWRDGKRPDDALLIMILLNRRSGRPTDADTVAPHDGEALLALIVEDGGVHFMAVLGAE